MLRSAALRVAGHTPGSPLRRRAVAALAASALLGAGLAVPASAAVELPAGHVPGVTLQTFQLAQDPGQVCTLRSGQTPNVDKVMPTIDWTSAEQFGASDNFVSHVKATLHVPEAGTYGLRVTNDDGALVYLDDDLVLENDGYNDSTSVETERQLTAGAHDLRIEYFEAGYDQRLELRWRTPGSSSWEIVPTSALSTDDEVVRVVAPGFKYCEGATDSPGDGLRLADVNPNYTLTDLRPEGFEPNVSGLDFTEDGRLVVATAGDVSSGGWVEDPHSGELYILDGVQEADGPEDVTSRLVAEDLFNPMGVDVIGDSIFVAERDGLTELVPEAEPADPENPRYVRSAEHGLDEDGNAHGQLATWPDGGNFHEFAFGLVHDDDNFYLSLSVAINNGGATTNPQPAQGRGTTIAVDRETGEVDFIAGGLRTPNGIGWGGTDGDDLFVMDNQGDWLPSSKLVHIKQDRFFNHYTNPAGPFDDQPVTQPVVWVPQNEIGNSPSNPFQLEAGPFAGQLLFGDVTYGGLQRAFLEEVDGEYQGAVFRHTAGLEAGVNRTIVGPDGAIYVGGIGEGGNWGESGKLRFGLQKLTPTSTDTFDIAEMRVVEGGFEIEYTEPIAETTAEDLAAAYDVTQWRYVPTPSYGGPKVNEQTLLVTGAELSEDGTTVTLEIDGLRPGHVVHVRSPRPFESASEKELWSTEAWYTLNSLPGYTGAADRGFYEAEEATLLGGAGTDTEHSGYSGTGFVDNIQSVGTGVRFNVSADEAGTHPIFLRYANGPNPFNGPKDLSLYVNGEKVGPWSLAPLGNWKTWGTATRDVELDAGANTIEVRYDEGDDGNVNIDALSIGRADMCEATPADAGYTSLFDGTLESFADWRLAGAGSFGRSEDCSLRTEGGMGLLWHPEELGSHYSLTLDWKLVKDDNGGVFVGFPDPGNDPWVAVNQGYEIQIDATDADDRTTGAIYTFKGADLEARDAALNPVGSWNSYEIVVDGDNDNIKVYLNDVLVNDFTSTDPARDLSSGRIGVQNHGGGETVFYRNIAVKELTAVEVTPEAVAFTDEVGTENDTYTIPAVEGVEYVVDGEVVPAGTHPGTGTVTVTARALDGYVLAEGATAEWTATFSTGGGERVLVPADKVSIGMFSLIPWVGQDGLPSVLARLAEIGFENVEPFGGNLNGYSAEEFRAMVDLIGLAVPSSHYNVGEGSFDATLAYVEELGQRYVGSGGFAAPGINPTEGGASGYENTLATAATMNRLGERSVEAGIGKFFGHNHAGEFTTVYEHDGEQMSAWEILVEETNPEYVTFQLDVAWAAHAGVDVPALIAEHGDRIELLHVKDATNLGGNRPTFTNLGEGDVDLQGILAAAQEHADVALYVLEYDVSPQGEEFARTGFEYLTGLEAGETGSRPVEVTPAAVTFTDKPGTVNDTVTVPRVAGVEYLIDGVVVAHGSHPGRAEVTVTARAAQGFELAEGSTTEWSTRFSVDQERGFFLTDDWSGRTHYAFQYGKATDEVHIGDWDGDGTDSIAVRRANTFFVSNSPRGGAADAVFHYGRPDDTVLVGDWDGDGTDTFAVRRGNEYFVKNTLEGGPADQVVRYGRSGDTVLVGDWDGDGSDTLAVRRGNQYFVKNEIAGGHADSEFHYGRAGDVTMSGDWDANGTDTLVVRRGATYYAKNTLTGGPADTVLTYGLSTDEAFAGDWDGDGADSIGVRRVTAVPGAPSMDLLPKTVTMISKVG